MKRPLNKAFFMLAAAVSVVGAQELSPKYFDCWMENVGHVVVSEQERQGIKTYGDAWICGCFNVEETEGVDWICRNSRFSRAMRRTAATRAKPMRRASTCASTT